MSVEKMNLQTHSGQADVPHLLSVKERERALEVDGAKDQVDVNP